MTMNSKSAVIVAFVLLVSGIAAGVSTIAAISNSPQDSTQDKMPSFTSYYQLSSFLDSAKGGKTYYQYAGVPSALDDLSGGESSSSPQSRDFSKTNVQVEGIDEADTVKTDGTYIYKSSYDSVAIIKAYPPSDMSVVSRINATDLAAIANETLKEEDAFVNAYISGLFLAPGKLVVIATVSFYQYNNYDGGYGYSIAAWYSNSEHTMLFIYDISDPKEPAFQGAFGMSGYSVTARMQGDVVYSVSQLYVWKDPAQGYDLPSVTDGSKESAVAVGDIHYDPGTKDPGYYLNILAVNLTDLKSKSLSIIAGWASTIYKSPSAFYLTIAKWPEAQVISIDQPVAFAMAAEEDAPTTTIYKVDVDGLKMHISEKGDVKGILNDQFSMDEKDGYLRVATSSGLWSDRRNAVYVLNGNLSVVGAIEGIAVNETIQANRFVGDRLYLVTFRQVDPLFVIDLSVPTAPEILGELTMPGFSTYLQPVDENHILGIGSENSSAKISLFDVTDPTSPIEDSKFIVGNFSSTSAGWEHKAMLFDAEKELLVIPMTTYDYYDWNATQSGFYVFNVSVDSGISLRDVIVHSNYSYYFYSEGRALYIEDYLYTISDTVVKANLISDLSEAEEFAYRESSDYWYGYGEVVRALSNAG